MADCGVMPANFFETLASCIVKNAEGTTFLNVAVIDAEDCNALDPGIDCDSPMTDPEAFVVANAFTVDDCGRPALKIGGDLIEAQ